MTPTGAAGIVGLLVVVGVIYLVWQRNHGDGYYEDEEWDEAEDDDEEYEVVESWYEYEYYEETTWRDD